MAYRVGSVPFLNARPLVWGLEGVEVVYRVPSALPPLLDSGEAQAILVSSVDALVKPDRQFVEGASISTHGEVRSVVLFSNVPFDRIGRLALDASSMTSNLLARLVLLEQFGCEPGIEPMEPDGDAMLAAADACVLIGDKGLTYPRDGRYSLDLGRAWSDATGLPFVWAFWVGGGALESGLAERLVAAARAGAADPAAVVSAAPLPPGVDDRLAHRYLGETFDYGWSPAHDRALAEFGARLAKHGLVEHVHAPAAVRPELTLAT
ncbi:MAG: menaquinone biosynthesis protein [Fimbriimonadaceae bacterium]|nr:menaquinone biosynthesis protein [Fimbriimonadaceae bacterium]QYK56424.1 MAG: menaquinone biosynthesis protein [Fimbriimonadaceae bacterium]